MSATARDKKHSAFLIAMGADLRGVRENTKVTQQEVAEYMGWQRAAVSKVEGGDTDISLHDYLVILAALRDVAAVTPHDTYLALQHPSHALREHISPSQPSRGRPKLIKRKRPLTAR